MDRMRVEGAGQKMAGKAKEAAGKLTGDNKLKAEGQADQLAGALGVAAAVISGLRLGQAVPGDRPKASEIDAELEVSAEA